MSGRGITVILEYETISEAKTIFFSIFDHIKAADHRSEVRTDRLPKSQAKFKNDNVLLLYGVQNDPIM